MIYNIFDTYQEAVDAQIIDYNMWINIYNSPADYVSKTVSWCPVTMRATDNKWIYQLCPVGIDTHIKEEFSKTWLPNEE